MPLKMMPSMLVGLKLVTLGAIAFFALPPPLDAGPRELQERQQALDVGIVRKLPRPGPEPKPEPEPEFGNSFFRLVQYRRGDSNGDGTVDISDAIDLFNFLFTGRNDPPTCLDAADSNRDNSLDISDAAHLLGFLFRRSSPPPAPGPHRCGLDTRPDESRLGCTLYSQCSEDLMLISHALDRITFGATEDLLTRIQTKQDLIDYIEEQLAAPDDYDQSAEEPELHERIGLLNIGFSGFPSAQNNEARVKSMLLVNAVESRWQLLHVVSQFWNNHFHTQLNALRENFFSRGRRGGGALQTTSGAGVASFAVANGINLADLEGLSEQEIFDLLSLEEITEDEWNAFRAQYPTAITYGDFGRFRVVDGLLTYQEYRERNQIAYWKYRGGREQFAIAADMERREYDLYRRLAFGSFHDLAEGCAKSVAMLIYLNGFENTVIAANENFGRELCELFTDGVDHNYTQNDIEQLSRILTGWTVDWVQRAHYAADDINFQGHPESPFFPVTLRHPRPLNLPTGEFWEDEIYTWAFVFAGRNARGQLLDDFGHDWGEKQLFREDYGGTDSLGNLVPPGSWVKVDAVPEDPADQADELDQRNVESAMAEFDVALDRLVGFRDCAKFISTKLIQLLVTDDLSLLKKTYPTPPDLMALFQAVDVDTSGSIDFSEWEAPVPFSDEFQDAFEPFFPFALPNGRPPDIFTALDVDGDGLITPVEYQEPDLLLDAIDAWTSSGGNIREVLRAVLLSDEFLSLKFYRAKVKTPFETVTSAIRALDGTYGLDQVLATINDITLAGMELFNFSDPTGESELGFDWMDTISLLERLKYVNRAANPASSQETRLLWDPQSFQTRWDLDSATETVDFLSLLLLNNDLLPSHRELAIEAYNQAASDKFEAAAAYVLSLPQFQKQ